MVASDAGISGISDKPFVLQSSEDYELHYDVCHGWDGVVGRYQSDTFASQAKEIREVKEHFNAAPMAFTAGHSYYFRQFPFFRCPDALASGKAPRVLGYGKSEERGLTIPGVSFS